MTQMPAFQNTGPQSGPASEGGENTLEKICLALLDQPIPEHLRRDTAAWVLEGFLQAEVHDPPGYAHYKVVQKQRPGPKHLMPLLELPLEVLLECLTGRMAFDLAYYSSDPGQNAAHRALKDYDWDALQRLREGLAGTGKDLNGDIV
jgi:hypothetical protein